LTRAPNSKNPFRMPVSPLQILLLIQLDSGPKYGYEMLKNIKEEFMEIWEPKTGSIYPALKSLEKKGLVTTNVMDGTDFYDITDNGRLLFDSMEKFVGKSVEFSTQYMIVIFKWMSRERKLGTLRMMQNLSNNEYIMLDEILNKLSDNIESDIQIPFLTHMRGNLEKRIEIIDDIIKKMDDV
jgi:DNA-binding PadR family transcriptional regulator